MTPETISFEDSAGRTEAQVLPELGFNCYRFQAAMRGATVDVLWADPEFASGTKRLTRSGIPILFPFPGRIGGTTFRYADRDYHLQPTDPLGNAMHGFVLGRPWRVVERVADRVVGEFQASRDDASILEHWPADFCIRVAYSVAAATLRADITITNPDRKVLPCGLGLHSYFRVPLGSQPTADQCQVSVPVSGQWELADMLPNGVRTESATAARLAAGLPFGHAQLDDVFQCNLDASGICTAAVRDPINRRTTTIRFGELFSQCVVFTPPHREAIAIEPYTTVPDAFRLLERGVDPHLLSIEPGGSLSTWFEVRLSDDEA